MALLTLSGCTATRNARLYGLDAADVLTATYKANGSRHGPIWIGETLQTATCKGEYVTVPHGSGGWGMIYGKGGPTFVTTSLTETDQQGHAIVTCDDGRVIEFEYITSALTGGGHGACEDNTSRRYRVMF